MKPQISRSIRRYIKMMLSGMILAVSGIMFWHILTHPEVTDHQLLVDLWPLGMLWVILSILWSLA